MSLKGFKLMCRNCGSEIIMESCSESTLDWAGDTAIHGEVLRRKCTECDNEDFTILKTWMQKE